MNQRGFAHIVILLVIVAAAIGGAYYFGINRSGKSNSPTSQPQACTMDAKLCPDGTSVGRIGPNCEFAQCPIVQECGTYKNDEEGYSFSCTKGWYLWKSDQEPGYLEELLLVDSDKVSKQNYKVEITLHNKVENIRDGLIAYYTGGDRNISTQNREINEVKVDGINSYKAQITSSLGEDPKIKKTTIMYFIPLKEENVLVIRADNKYSSDLENLVNTLKIAK